MSLYFATCVVNTAKEYLKRSFPEKEIDEASAPKFFEAVGKDWLRVCDPNFHSKGMVIGGDKFTEASPQEIEDATKEIKAICG